MTAFNARLQLFRTDENCSLRTLIFNFDTIREFEEVKELVIQAHLTIVNKPVHQVQVVSILDKVEAG